MLKGTTAFDDAIHVRRAVRIEIHGRAHVAGLVEMRVDLQAECSGHFRASRRYGDSEAHVSAKSSQGCAVA